MWCCLDGSAEQGEKLEPKDAFHAVTGEIHGLLVQCSQLYRHSLDYSRRLDVELREERQRRVNAENRASLRKHDADFERRLREAREQADAEVADAEERARAAALRAADAAERLAAAEKELLVLRTLVATSNKSSVGTPHTNGLVPYLNTAA